MQVKVFFADSKRQRLVCKIVEQASLYLTLPDIVEVEFQKLGPSAYGETDIVRKRITINQDLELNDIVLPLVHELIHLEQIETGRLAKSRQGQYVWDNASYRADPRTMLHKDYSKLPWELDVAKKQQKILDNIIKNQ
jgi:hypothetical protein